MPLLPAFPRGWSDWHGEARRARLPLGDHGDTGNAATLARERMVDEQVLARGVRNPRVLQAMRDVPRHLFVPAAEGDQAYDDTPLPIGHGQTISQPYIVALMTELADPQPGDIVLDVGTGCGYQAAVLSRLVTHVFSIELVEPLAHDAAERLARLGYANVTVRSGDGHAGWPEEAPFDSVLGAAAPEHVPAALVAQLRPGGRLVIPVGPLHAQELMLIRKDEHGRTTTASRAAVRFVPMVTKGAGGGR